MSAKHADDEELYEDDENDENGDDDDDDDDEEDDDDDDEDEGDFVPGADDSDDDEDDEDIEQGPLGTPPFLQGQLYKDAAGKLTYQDDETFCLVSQEPLSELWTLHNPTLTSTCSTTKMSGWVQDPSKIFHFELVITKESGDFVRGDALLTKLLHAQEDHHVVVQNGKLPALDLKPSGSPANNANSIGKKPAAAARPKEEEDSDLGKKSEDAASSPRKKAASPASLKSPPLYSLKQPPATDSSKKKPPALSSPERQKQQVVYSLVGKQVDDANGVGQPQMEFTGVFHAPNNNSKSERLFLISSLQKVTSSSAGAGPAVPVAAAAAARKRSHSNGPEDDDLDEEDVDDQAVEFNELIALHDDANLSTEELRQKYYGGGKPIAAETAAAAAASSSSSNKRTKPGQEDDDDDDDDVGF
jgi:hypothetical protein